MPWQQSKGYIIVYYRITPTTKLLQHFMLINITKYFVPIKVVQRNRCIYHSNTKLIKIILNNWNDNDICEKIQILLHCVLFCVLGKRAQYFIFKNLGRDKISTVFTFEFFVQKIWGRGRGCKHWFGIRVPINHFQHD